MSFLHSMVSIQMGWIVAAGIVAALFLALWIATLLSRRWYVTLRNSPETELMWMYLSRIANSLDKLASSRETPVATAAAVPEEIAPMNAGAARPVTFSMLGH
jgi:hypothetical protein